MKDSTIIILGVGALAIVAFVIWNKNNSSLTIGKNGITGNINVSQLAGAAGSILGSLENSFSSGSSNSSGYSNSVDDSYDPASTYNPDGDYTS